ncbi:MAG: hypothetical protein FE041_03550 [Thermoplasmata archaeon]|nr:MAG: hypothetical protein FE041_03550 [Thermoplasmata archaeon]
MLKLLSSFSFAISLAIVLGIATGGFPKYDNEIATIALILAMTFSIANISFKIKLKEEAREMLIAFLLNYVLLSSIIILMGYLVKKYFEGFVVMAAAPPAIAVVPLTAVLRGDERHSLFSLIFLYLMSVILMPLIILIFLATEVKPVILLQNVALLILLPILLSRIFYGRIDASKAKIIANICFFFIVFSVIGKNRQFIFEDLSTLFILSILMTLRTFGIGSISKMVAEKIGSAEKAINYALFSSFKNEGFVMIIAFSLFGYSAAIPAIIALIFEMLWICCMEAKII